MLMFPNHGAATGTRVIGIAVATGLEILSLRERFSHPNGRVARQQNFCRSKLSALQVVRR
jgi:hypothetical protein